MEKLEMMYNVDEDGEWMGLAVGLKNFKMK